MSAPVLSVVMPVYDEAATVVAAVEAALAADLGVAHELIVVDDGSTDGTAGTLAQLGGRPGLRLLAHDRNRGKGAALRTGLAAARGELVAILDADLEYTAQDIALLLPPLLAGECNAVFGTRAFDGYTSHSFLYVLGNRAMTLTANVLFNVYLRDLMTCHKVVRTDVMRGLGLRADGFAIEAEIAGRLLRRGERIFEIPVSYRARSREAGKKLTAADGLRVAAQLVRCRVT